MHNPLTHFQATTIASQIPYLNRWYRRRRNKSVESFDGRQNGLKL